MKNSTEPTTHYRAFLLNEIPINIKGIKRYKYRKAQVYNYPVSFDIESTSFYENKEKRAIMYEWSMCFGDSEFLVYGRTWDEWLYFMELVRKHFHLTSKKFLFIYCHNLSFEFQWIRKRLQWSKVFATDKREVLTAQTTNGFEFRCSLRLSGYRLETLAHNLLYHDIEKLVGNLDYSKTRHEKTPLTPEELAYCFNDVRIVCAYIAERIQADGNITKIPLTKTGYVRRDCRNAVYGTDKTAPKYYAYRDIMLSMSVEVEEFKIQRHSFMGGYTHANCHYTGVLLKRVGSIDFTSSYPFTLFSERFPWGKGERVNVGVEDIIKTRSTYAYIMDIEFYGIESTVLQDDYISLSKCTDIKGYVVNNGRVNRADYLRISITSIDLFVILNVYRFHGGFRILRAYRYPLAYLPKDFIMKMLEYYEKKTKLKGVVGKEEEYLYSKEAINSFYGMVVTSPIRPDIVYENDEWSEKNPDIEKAISKYNKDKGRFMPYIVGVFVTAYARYNLWNGIVNVGTDYVYSDTDSIKLLHPENHLDYIKKYNKAVVEKLNEACAHYGIPFSMVSPKTIEGKEKTLGVWDYEGTYERFKTLGAKRYMYEMDGKLHITVSGLNKEKGAKYLSEKFGNDKAFEMFHDEEFNLTPFCIKPPFSGRMVSSYIDEETEGYIKDYNGEIMHYNEKSSLHLEETQYTLSMSDDYLKFLFGVIA